MFDWLGHLGRLFWSRRGEVWTSTAAHLDLVLEALLLALLVGIPLAVMASRSRTVERVVVGLANVLQTIPSLALLGFLLIAFRGEIGRPPALAALTLYSLLPIIKNTVIGLRGVEPGVLEAATGMGMTAWQRLRHVEFPLAIPVILGGLRLAAVSSIGIATIAALIGAQSLGGFIFRGVALSDPGLILLGAVPTALLALGGDLALGEVEHQLDPRRPRRSWLRSLPGLLTILALVGVASWGAWEEYRPKDAANTIRIGSKDSTEPILLGHMLAELVEDRTDLRVDRRLNLGGSLVCYNALARGGLDAYVEYTGTALTTILHQPDEKDPDAVLSRVRTLCLQRDGVRVLDPLGFENTFAILMRREQADRLGIRRISDLRDHEAQLRFGAGPEFMNRPDGYPGLIFSYGIKFKGRPVEMDRNLLYEAVSQDTIDVASGDSTDGRVADLDLVVLEDDRRYFPPYHAVPLANDATLRRHPALLQALNALAGRIDGATMRRLNSEVDGKKREPRDVAREFLQSAGLLGR
jgi:osmoprotectant transport system permease protein